MQKTVSAPNLTMKPSLARRRMAAFALTSFVSFGVITMDGCDSQSFNIGPSKGQVVGAILGAAVVLGGTTGVVIEVHPKHQTAQGCASSGTNGAQDETAY